jgi:hypothetical protein
MRAGSSFESSYVYGGNSPLRFTDPTGMRKCNSGRGRTGSCSENVEYTWGRIEGHPTNDVYDQAYFEQHGVFPPPRMISPNISCHPNSDLCNFVLGPEGVNSMVVPFVPERMDVPSLSEPVPDWDGGQLFDPDSFNSTNPNIPKSAVPKFSWKKMSDGRFEQLFGESAGAVKKEIVGKHGSKFNLFEDTNTGDVYVLSGKTRVGEPQPT